MYQEFDIKSPFEPKGDQPSAISALTDGINSDLKNQVLLGVTGSGKTFTIAHVIKNIKRPTLILAHNKTLAAQLYSELKEFFPQNEIHYFVSYYDYYQPEAYIPATDTYIEKDASINEYIDRLRHAATTALFERNDVIIVASVSSIYGIGAPKDYYGMLTTVEKGMQMPRNALLKRLEEVQYHRKNNELNRSTYRVKGDIVDVFPSHEDSIAFRIEFFGDYVEEIKTIDPVKGSKYNNIDKVIIFPGSHYVAPKERMKLAIDGIKSELKEQLKFLRSQGKELESNRLEERTKFDIELLETMGFCPGIENYSRHISGRKPGQPPFTLIDYFPDNFLCVIDESHQMIPQLKAMYLGDRSRKNSLVDNGFRLPSALDNRPLSFEEFKIRMGQIIYVSATPGPYERDVSGENIVEQIIRPTGLADPVIEIRSAQNQVDDLLEEIRKVLDTNERVLITTLTKKMAEDLTDYYKELELRVRYLHSEIDTLERIKIVRDLRVGKFDVLIGINLLREGLDIPEVSLVVILDADKEGYLRSETSLIQIFGRAARNINGRVLLYADTITKSMQSAISETKRRRKLQLEYNKLNDITPRSIKKNITDILSSIYEGDYITVPKEEDDEFFDLPPNMIPKLIFKLNKQMKAAAKRLEFEKAAETKIKIQRLRELEAKYASEIK